jgi:RNA polymerase sigma factor (sigma-70 family)
MDDTNSGDAPSGDPTPGREARRASDPGAELAARLQQGDEDAINELYVRYLPLMLSLTRQHRVLPSEREELALDVLTEAALQLRRPESRVPRSLPGLLATMLRRRVLDRRRREAVQVPVVSVDDVPESALVHSGDRSRAPRVEASALTRLADHIEAHVDDTELVILHWLGERVPQRIIAEWLGLSHGAVRMRIGRLRDRLREVVRTYWLATDSESHESLARFFARFAAGSAGHPTTRSPGRAPGGRRHGSPT